MATKKSKFKDVAKEVGKGMLKAAAGLAVGTGTAASIGKKVAAKKAASTEKASIAKKAVSSPSGGKLAKSVVTGATTSGLAKKSSGASKKTAKMTPLTKAAPTAAAGSGANLTKLGGNITRDTRKKTY